jgi:hypothetical protein
MILTNPGTAFFSDPIQQKPEPRGRLRNYEHLSHLYFDYLSLA